MSLRIAVVGLLCIGAPADMAPDPLPIRREVIAVDQFADKLARSGDGPFQRMPREKFEERVAAAVRGVSAALRNPKLLTHHGQAELVGSNLTGFSRWTISANENLPALLRLDSLSVAIRSMRWADDSPVVAGRLDSGESLSVLVDKSTQRELIVEWSARGSDTVEGLRFELQWPACAVSEMDLTLPAGTSAIADAENGIVHGSKLLFGGRSSISLLLRPKESLTAAPFLTCQYQGQIKIGPSQIEVSAELALSKSKGRIDKFILEHSSSFQPLQVTAKQLVKWRPISRNQLEIEFASPISTATVTVHGVMVLPKNKKWSAPELLTVGSVFRGESVTIQTHPQIELVEFDAGSLKLDGARKSSDGGQILALTSRWDRPNAERPSAFLRVTDSIVDVTDHLDWDIGGQRQTLTCESELVVRGASLSRWSIGVPTDWSVVAVDRQDASTNISWTSAEVAGKSELALVFDPPIPAGAVMQLTVTLQGRPPLMVDGPLPFPDPAPRVCRCRTATISCRVSPLFEHEARPSAAAEMTSMAGGPLAKPIPSFSYSYRSLPIDGVVTLRPRPARLIVQGTTTVQVEHDRINYRCEIHVNPEGGAIDAVLLRTSNSTLGDWRASGAVRIRNIHCLDVPCQMATVLAGGSNALSTSANLLAPRSGSFWCISFDRPIATPLTLIRAKSLPLSERVSVPLWFVNGASEQNQAVVVNDPQARSQQIYEEMQPQSSKDGATEYRSTTPDPRLTLLFPMADASLVQVESPRLTVSVPEAGRPVVAFRARVRAGQRSQLVVQLPAGTEFLTALVSDNEVAAASLAKQTIGLPLTPDPAGNWIEVLYALPIAKRGPVARIAAPAPRFPDTVENFAALPHVWRLPPGLLPVFESGLSRRAGTDAVMPRSVLIGEVASTSSSLWLVHQSAVMALATGMTIACAASGVLLWPYVGRRFVIASIAIGALAWIWLPEPFRPIVVGPMLLVIAAAVFGRVLLPTWTRRFSATAVSLLLIVGSNVAESPSPATVWIVPAGDGTSFLAYAPEKLLNRLDALARSGAPQVSAAIVSADYECTCDSQTARLNARWSVHSFRESSRIVIPIAGMQLKNIQVDGANVLPKLIDNRLEINFQSTDTHSVTAQIELNPEQLGNERVARFSAPESATARLTWKLPGGAAFTRLPKPAGAVVIDGEMLTADLRPTKATIEMGWSTNKLDELLSTKASAEAYYWDLSGATARLWCIWKCPTPERRAMQLNVNLPHGFEPLSVRAAEPDVDVAWDKQDKAQSDALVIRMNSRSADSATVIAELAVRGNLNEKSALPFPSTSGSGPLMFAWRGNIQPGPLRGVIPTSVEAFVNEFISAARLDLPIPTAAFRSVRREDPVELIAIPAQGGAVRSSGDIRWHLRPSGADVFVENRLRAQRGESLIEWKIPDALIVAEVKGEQIARWTQSGERLQVWLNEPHEETLVTWIARMHRGDDSGLFETPLIRLANAEETNRIAISSVLGWTLSSIVTKGLDQVIEKIPGSPLQFRTTSNDYRLTVRPQPSAGQAQVQSRTIVDYDDAGPTATTTIEIRTSGTSVCSFAVNVRASVHDEVKLDVSPSLIAYANSNDGRHAWHIIPPANSGDLFRVTITARPTGTSYSWNVPLASVEFGELKPVVAEHDIRVNSGIRIRDSVGLVEQGPGWRPVRPNWQMSVQLMSGPANRARDALNIDIGSASSANPTYEMWNRLESQSQWLSSGLVGAVTIGAWTWPSLRKRFGKSP